VVTIRDVARRARVSTATVSRVFNGTARVSAEAERRVRASASRLDYWPNSAARSLTTSRSHALGVLLPDLFGEFFSEIIRGIDHAARTARFQVLVSSSHADTAELVAAARAMRGRIDGLIAMVPDCGSADAVCQLARQFPVVLLNPPATIDGCRKVSVANFEGAQAVVHHLVRLGHRRIALLQGPPGNVDADERRRGYREALRESGLPVDPQLELAGDFTEASGYQAAAAALRLRPRPQAVFAANDYMAIGFMGSLRDAGLRVPQDMAVTGFDDIAIARYLSPPLTTVHVDAYQLGERAFRSLAGLLDAPRTRRREHEVLVPTLVVRRSCGAGPANAEALRPRRRRIVAHAEAPPPAPPPGPALGNGVHPGASVSKRRTRIPSLRRRLEP
jgi:LacI family transcriptional regulator